MLWRQLLKRLLALDCASYESFSKSGNTVVTVTEHAARPDVPYNLLDCMNHLATFFQLFKAWLARVHSPSTTM